MSRLHTLRSRLTAFTLLAAAGAIALLVVAFNLVLAGSLDRDANSRLRSQAAAAATSVTGNEGRIRIENPAAQSRIDSHVWVFSGGREVLRPAAPPPAVQQQVERMASGRRGFRDVASAHARLYAFPHETDGRRVGTVVVGLSLEAYDRTTDIALLASLALAAVLLAAVFGITWVTTGRALRPVTEMTRAAAAWTEHDRARRFGSAPRPDELGELAATFDALLDRLSASLRHEQRLSAELSHELRTPLARIVAEIELLQRRERPAEEREAAYESVIRSAGQMNRILETLMTAARAEAHLQEGRSELGQSLAQLGETWREPLSQRGIELRVPSGGDGVLVGVDADVVERIVEPLLDNAGHHASSLVQLDATRRGGRVLLSIHDDGPGVSADERERIFEPGVRGAAVNGHAGSGLGLALARRLARAAGAEISVQPDGGPGAHFLVDLPA